MYSRTSSDNSSDSNSSCRRNSSDRSKGANALTFTTCSRVRCFHTPGTYVSSGVFLEYSEMLFGVFCRKAGILQYSTVAIAAIVIVARAAIVIAAIAVIVTVAIAVRAVLVIVAVRVLSTN